MFTGIVTDVGRIRSLDRRAHDARIVIETTYDTDTMAIGASVACAGICLTVVERGKGWFAVEAAAETLSVTTLGAWQAGRRINLERSLRLGDELGGHLVSGHVDGVAELLSVTPQGAGAGLTIAAPSALARYVATKGSVALDGVSLTINWVDDVRFGMMIIPHTQQATTLGAARPGDRFNLEIDMLARYVQRILGKD